MKARWFKVSAGLILMLCLVTVPPGAAAPESPAGPDAGSRPVDYLGEGVLIESAAISANAASAVALHFATVHQGEENRTWLRTKGWDLGGNAQSTEPEYINTFTMPGLLSIPDMPAPVNVPTVAYWQPGIQEVEPPEEGSSNVPKKAAFAEMAQSSDNPNGRSKRWVLSSQRLRLRTEVPLPVKIERHFVVKTWAAPLYDISVTGASHANYDDSQIESVGIAKLTLPPEELVSDEYAVPIIGTSNYRRWAEVSEILFETPVAHRVPSNGEILTLPLPGGDLMDFPLGDESSGSPPPPNSTPPTPGQDFTNAQFSQAPDLRVAKLENSLLPNAEGTDEAIFPHLDEDCFRITFPGLKRGVRHYIKLETRHADGTICDGPKEVELLAPPPHLNFHATPLMLLVSDDEDNTAPVMTRNSDGTPLLLTTADPRRAMYTHKVSLGGKVIITSLRSEGSTEIAVDGMEREVKIRGTIRLKIGILSDASTNLPALHQKVEEEVLIAKERLAQIGLAVDHHIRYIPISNTGMTDSNYQQSISPSAPGSDERRIAGTIDTDLVTDFHVFYCQRIRKENIQEVNGYFFRPGANEANSIFINSQIHTIFTMVHELVHAMERRIGHYGGTEPTVIPGDYDLDAPRYKVRHNLLRGGGTSDDKSFTGSKRLHKEQELRIFGKTQP